MTDTKNTPPAEHAAGDPDCDCCAGTGLWADGETLCPCTSKAPAEQTNGLYEAALDTIADLRAELAEYHAPRPGVRGLDAATIEACAQLVEKHSIQDTGFGKILTPRMEGDRQGLHYAVAIRALVTDHGSKSDLHPEYVTTADGSDHGYKSTLHPGNVPSGGDE